MYEVQDKDTMKYEILPPICLWQNVAKSQKVIGRKLFNVVFTSRKPFVNGRLLLRFHDIVPIAREQHALQPLDLAVASLHVFRAIAMRAYMA